MLLLTGPDHQKAHREAELILTPALRWLESHATFFDPFRSGTLVGLNEIPLSELGILTLSLLRVSGSEETARATKTFLDVLEQACEQPVFRQRPFREPESLVSHLIVMAALELGGRLRVGNEREAFARLIKASNLCAPSLPPHRTMELRHAADLARLPVRMPTYRALYRRTAAARPLNPIFLSRAEHYIITHVIFYATDLGFEAPQGIDVAEQARLAGLIQQLLGMSVAAADLDLTAEFLLCSLALGHQGAFDEIAWSRIRASQQEDGAVPGRRAAHQQPSDHPRDAFDEVAASYHTTLVCALAALTAIHKLGDSADGSDDASLAKGRRVHAGTRALAGVAQP
jgi:hypothetical protein